ncbi:MAG TPA: GNAT family N-acetyltransferase [candidate division Zixibacteria bacterium]|nr:GNAT family N-acetyltransferase [candidate division Zixibacteria bacterium]
MTTDTTRAAADELRPAIPGLTVRTYRPEDAAALAELYNLGAAADRAEWRVDAEEMANWFGSPNDSFDAGRDAFLVEVGGHPVATMDVNWVDTTDGLREFRIGCVVHPAWRGRGIGRWLQALGEEHSRELARRYPTDRPLVFGGWIPDTATASQDLLRRFGYEPVRYFFDMVRPTLENIPEPVLPEGLEIRPVTEEQLPQLWAADVEAFRDHWGGFDESEERYQRWRSDPKFDPSLFVVAWDGDEVAGGVFNEINEAENTAFNRRRGWLASVFVRRPWRRRGLGTTLVLRSLQVLRDRGMTSAGLGVDAANPTGALGIYERVGFEVSFRSTAFRKPMTR